MSDDPASYARITDDHDPVSSPDHYRWLPGDLEVIDITEGMSFCHGNVVKYVLRADHKGSPIEDLRKAQWYLDREIERRQSEATAGVVTEETATVAVDAGDRLWMWRRGDGLWTHPGRGGLTLDELRLRYGPLDLGLDGRSR